jgi:hypothetical protein
LHAVDDCDADFRAIHERRTREARRVRASLRALRYRYADLPALSTFPNQHERLGELELDVGAQAVVGRVPERREGEAQKLGCAIEAELVDAGPSCGTSVLDGGRYVALGERQEEVARDRLRVPGRRERKPRQDACCSLVQSTTTNGGDAVVEALTEERVREGVLLAVEPLDDAGKDHAGEHLAERVSWAAANTSEQRERRLAPHDGHGFEDLPSRGLDLVQALRDGDSDRIRDAFLRRTAPNEAEQLRREERIAAAHLVDSID